MLLARRYNRAKKREGGSGRNQHSEERDQNDPVAQRTAERLAKEHGVSPATVKRAGKKRFNEVRREIKRAEVKEAVKLPDAKYRYHAAGQAVQPGEESAWPTGEEKDGSK
ncbi:MAG: hypothetical protein WD042_03070 [Phycisphaeraceae bacterium]